MNTEINDLIKKFEARMKMAARDQMTSFDDMHPKKYEGYRQAYEEVIYDLKKCAEKQSQ